MIGTLSGVAFAGGSGQHGHSAHSESDGIDQSAEAAPEADAMDHSEMQGMDHSKMPGMDHSKVQDMDHQHDSMESSAGHPASEELAKKAVHVFAMDTMQFEFFPQPDLNPGDVVKFVITNQGKVAHEFSIGDRSQQEAHREMMRKMPDMVHDDGTTVTIPPGETRELTWQFTGASEVEFACNIPGHYEAGMFARAKVQPRHEH
jgi:uncharacterized cupredoxin-like copper-binding protein